MWKKKQKLWFWWVSTRRFSRISAPKPAVIRGKNNVAQLGPPKFPPKPRQLLSLPPYPGHHLPAKTWGRPAHVTAVTWIKYYFHEVEDSVIQSQFNKGLVQMECEDMDGDSVVENGGQMKAMKKIKPNEVMKEGARVFIPVSVLESRISKRYDTIPSGTLNPNADEIDYLQRLVKYKDSAILLLNKPPKFPVKGNLPVHNSMDALAAAALSFGNNEGPKLVHRLDRESSGLLLMGRTKESVSLLNWLFSDLNKGKSSCKAWNDACEATYQRYWALVIGSPKEKEGLIRARLSKVLLDDGKTEQIILGQHSGLEASQEAVTEYRVLGPMINECSWIELRPHTMRKHQCIDLGPCSLIGFSEFDAFMSNPCNTHLKLRVHCAEALGTPIVGDYKYGWFVHRRWKQMPHVDVEPTTGAPYKLRRPEGLDIQKGSVLSKVPLLHLHCRELVLPNIAKFLHVLNQKSEDLHLTISSKPDLLQFVALMPSHMKISWNLMSSYLV